MERWCAMCRWNLGAALTSEQWLEKYGKCDKESDLPDKPDRPLH